MRQRRLSIRAILAVAILGAPAGPAQEARLELRKGDRVVFVGNTFAERLQLFGYLETGLLLAYPDLDLSFRNLAWSADEITLQPRPLNFGDLHGHLRGQEADVVFLFYGANEAFAGEEGLETFRTELRLFLDDLKAHRYSGEPPRLVLVSPIPQEGARGGPDPELYNAHARAYAATMSEVAAQSGVPFVDLFEPMERTFEESAEPLTRNGMHLGAEGYRLATAALLRSLGIQASLELTPEQETVRATVIAKNKLFFDRYRAVNGYYIYGDRKEPFGVVNFPPEMVRFDELVAELDRELNEQSRAAAGGDR